MKTEDVDTVIRWVLLFMIGFGIGHAMHSGGFGCAAFAIATLWVAKKAGH